MTVGRAVLYVATVAGVGLFIRSLVLGPLPVWFATAAFVGYIAVVVAGVIVPQWQMFGPVVWRGPGDRGEVVLTFDDGPHPETTRQVLDSLDKAGVKATFFVLGAKVAKHPDVAAEIVSRGHTLGLHGLTHDRWMSLRSPARIERELTEALDIIEKATGYRPWLFRPPVGHVSPRTDTAADRLDLVVVAWSARGLDGLRSTTPARLAARIRRNLGPGALILLHDAPERDQDLRVPAAIEALPAILDDIAARGLRVVELTSWLDDDGRSAAETPTAPVSPDDGQTPTSS